MGIFATSKDVGRLRSSIADLQDDVQELKRTTRSLELEFTELYDKVRHQMSRMAKRDAMRASVEPIVEEDLPLAEPANGVDAISQKILDRRARGVIQQ